ncbi:MAG TPA: M1 family metallopeptidase [Chitinophagaceae bacterium]|nr:M1 family metallopeptidase [Chitinophagaceae bacterium]
MKYFWRAIGIFFFLLAGKFSEAQYTHQDTLRGTIGPERSWWDVLHYDISVTPDYNNKTITGRTTIQYKVLPNQKSDYLQIDLQQPLKIDTLFYDEKLYINYPGKPYYNEGNVWHIPLPKAAVNSIHSISIAYHGNPRIAVRAPWDGGWIFTRDEKGRPWMTVACQGLGASVWYPCKDHQSDEPDNGATLSITVVDSLVAVGNGRLKNKISGNGMTTWSWEVKNPINSYNIVPYIGKYVNFTDTLMGEKGNLDCSYWVLDYNLDKAKKQFGRDVKPMLHCFEYWFGPYPFYEDSYKLVESSHLGMEHQSATAYGNHYVNGYYSGGNGFDLSGSGWGMKWDYIIVHESGHEWFANNITTNDIADMWVHEGFTDYSEPLFVECQYGKKAADEYCQGLRRNIQNDVPVIGPYGVNKEGSGDMYAKGANMLHTIRQVINDDEKFRQILRGLNKDFYHKTVDSRDVERYMSEKSGIDLSKIFDQYLRTVRVPVLEYKMDGKKLSYRWTNCVDGFNLPVQIGTAPGFWLKPTLSWQETELPSNYSIEDINKNFYITVKKAR